MVFCKPPKVNTCGKAAQLLTKPAKPAPGRLAPRRDCPHIGSPMPTHLPAETLSLEGADATAFAQTQFSSHVDALANGRWQFSAWLDPQGRVRAFFHLVRISDEQLLLLLRGGDAVSLAEALQRFVFRSRVTLRALPARSLGSGPAQPLHEVRMQAGGDTLSLGCGDHSLQVVRAEHGNGAWRLAQWRAGWPWLPDQALGTLLPPALSLYRLQAVAIDKGCYPGQELVARLHYRGGHKRHLHSVTLSQTAMAGTPLQHDGRELGRLLDVIQDETGTHALAVLNDELTTTGILPVFADGLALRSDTAWPA